MDIPVLRTGPLNADLGAEEGKGEAQAVHGERKCMESERRLACYSATSLEKAF